MREGSNLLAYRYTRQMACPFFEPRTKLGDGPLDPPPRLPLGHAWAGVCVAPGFASHEPEETEQREICNTGYARGRCGRFPSNAEADAVRFSADQDGRLVYILEKNHAPVRHGRVSDLLESPLLEQARAFGDQPV
jgi:hypothetical protein